MPQATDEQRARWPGWDTEAIEYLESHGFTQTDWCWRPPEMSHVLSEREADAINFLINEFDWGGLV